MADLIALLRLDLDFGRLVECWADPQAAHDPSIPHTIVAAADGPISWLRSHMADVAPHVRGLRVLWQPVWPTLVSFLLSQNNNVARITQLVARIHELGDPVAFDDTEALAEALVDATGGPATLPSHAASEHGGCTCHRADRLDAVSCDSAAGGPRVAISAGALAPPPPPDAPPANSPGPPLPPPASRCAPHDLGFSSRSDAVAALAAMRVFPSPPALAAASDGDLRSLGCGYRAPYIIATAAAVAAAAAEQAHSLGPQSPGCGAAAASPAAHSPSTVQSLSSLAADCVALHFTSDPAAAAPCSVASGLAASVVTALREYRPAQPTASPVSDPTASSGECACDLTLCVCCVPIGERRDIPRAVAHAIALADSAIAPTVTPCSAAAPAVAVRGGSDVDHDALVIALLRHGGWTVAWPHEGATLAPSGPRTARLLRTRQRTECDSDETLREALTSLKGVGSKVADCVALFAFTRSGLVPCDTHVLQMASQYTTPIFEKAVASLLLDGCLKAAPEAHNHNDDRNNDNDDDDSANDAGGLMWRLLHGSSAVPFLEGGPYATVRQPQIVDVGAAPAAAGAHSSPLARHAVVADPPPDGGGRTASNVRRHAVSATAPDDPTRSSPQRRLTKPQRDRLTVSVGFASAFGRHCGWAHVLLFAGRIAGGAAKATFAAAGGVMRKAPRGVRSKDEGDDANAAADDPKATFAKAGTRTTRALGTRSAHDGLSDDDRDHKVPLMDMMAPAGESPGAAAPPPKRRR